VGRVGRDEVAAVAAVVADPDRDRQRQARVEPCEPLEQLLAMGVLVQVEDGLVVKRRQLDVRERTSGQV
jgi:hypothetical protein